MRCEQHLTNYSTITLITLGKIDLILPLSRQHQYSKKSTHRAFLTIYYLRFSDFCHPSQDYPLISKYLSPFKVKA